MFTVSPFINVFTVILVSKQSFLLDSSRRNIPWNFAHLVGCSLVVLFPCFILFCICLFSLYLKISFAGCKILGSPFLYLITLNIIVFWQGIAVERLDNKSFLVSDSLSTIYKGDGYCIAQGTQLNPLCWPIWEESLEKSGYMCVCVADSLFCASGTNTTL